MALSHHADVGFFEYPTSLFRLPFSTKAPRIGNLAEGLRSQIENRYSRYESITLVCHSLGGLVARKYLVEEARKRRPWKVDKLLLFAVPNEGSQLAPIATQISWRHNQLVQLCRNSEFLDDLNRDWADVDKEGLEVVCVVGSQDRVVDKHSAARLCGADNVETILDADHRSIVKPRTSADLAFLILRRVVLGPAQIFVSVGGGRSGKQEHFVQSVYQRLREIGLEPQTVDDYGAANTQPLTDVARRMEGCYGAVVLAFERTFIEKGISRPEVLDRRTPIDGTRLPTVWNQIEAAIAYTRGLPLLVLVEHGLSDEGMLESKYDWRVMWVDLDAAAPPREFDSVLHDWKRQVLSRRGDP